MAAVTETIEAVQAVTDSGYKWGFETDIEMDFAPKGLNEDIVRFISAKKKEPAWLLEWRLKAYRHWLTMEVPHWAAVSHPPIDFQDAYYYAAPKQGPKSLDEVDPELLKTYAKLGIPLKEQAILAGVEGAGETPAEGRMPVAVDAVFDSVSVATSYKERLAKDGIVFCAISEAVHSHPELMRQYLGSVVPQGDNYYAALNSAVFTDGSFVYIPKGVRCPMELSTYFRINAKSTGQFERTLIIADEGSTGLLPRGLHGAHARREPAACGGGGTGGAGRRDHQVQHRAELVSRRCRGPGRHLQLRHQARRLPRCAVQDLLDSGGDGQRHHLEVSLLHPAGR
jgi:Fe-S cluster assembly protein SufB